MEDNSVNKSVIIFLLSICIISLGLGIYANYRLIKINRDNKVAEKKKKVEDNKNKDNNKDVEKEIKSQELLNMIKDKQVVLKNYTSDDISFKKARIYDNNVDNKSLEEDKKLVAVIYTLFENDKKYEELDKNKYPNITPNAEGSTLIISSTDVKDLYSKTFGGELDVNTSLPEDLKNNFYYNAEYDVYVINAGFGGSCTDSTLTYDYKYTEDFKHVYVYSAMAYQANCPYEIYKENDKQNKYEYDGNEFMLDETNYKDFNQYKITYLKNNENYVFDKIEKIN